MNLVHYLAQRAEQHPDRAALFDAQQSLSFAQLYAHVCGGSRQLREDGLGPGDTILILQAVGIPLYISLLSAFHAGLTVMFIDPSAGKAATRNSLSLHQPQAFIGVAKAHLLRLTIPEIRRIPKRYHASAWLPGSRQWNPGPAPCHDPVETTPDSPALITFTSGSTGMPKAACRSHGFLLAQHEALAKSLDYREGEVDLVTLPVFALANLASGLSSVIADSDLAYPARVNSLAIAKQCERHHVTRCAASPAFFEKLYRDDRFPNFTSIYTGGAPVFPSMLEKIQSLKPGMNVVTVFGSTEAEPISHISWHDTTAGDRERMFAGQGLLVGKAVSATQLRIIPDQFGEALEPLSKEAFETLALPGGEIGEMVVTGDHVLKGYLNGKGNEESKIQVGDEVWHRTGDAAYLDHQGRVWLLGRCQAAIRLPGKDPIYPFGIECAAMTHPAVRRCALLLHENRVTLFVEGDIDHAALSELRFLLKSHPVESIRQIPRIPVDKRHNAKIDYPALLAELCKEPV